MYFNLLYPVDLSVNLLVLGGLLVFGALTLNWSTVACHFAHTYLDLLSYLFRKGSVCVQTPGRSKRRKKISWEAS